jgi:hypothetical protein
LTLILPLLALAAVVGLAIAGRQREPARDGPAVVAVGVATAFPVLRETGADGLMGRLPLGLPAGTPVPIVTGERHDRFVTDDVVPGWSDSSHDGPTPAFRVRVLGPNSDAYVL